MWRRSLGKLQDASSELAGELNAQASLLADVHDRKPPKVDKKKKKRAKEAKGAKMAAPIIQGGGGRPGKGLSASQAKKPRPAKVKRETVLADMVVPASGPRDAAASSIVIEARADGDGQGEIDVSLAGLAFHRRNAVAASSGSSESDGWEEERTQDEPESPSPRPTDGLAGASATLRRSSASDAPVRHELMVVTVASEAQARVLAEHLDELRIVIDGQLPADCSANVRASIPHNGQPAGCRVEIQIVLSGAHASAVDMPVLVMALEAEANRVLLAAGFPAAASASVVARH